MSILRKKSVVCIIAFALVIAVSFYFVGAHFQNGLVLLTRTVTLQETQIDYQSILDDFDDAELTIDGAFIDFVGSKRIDASVFEKIDNLSVNEKVELQENSNVVYRFTYDIDINVVTIEAKATLPNGEILLDTIEGVGFYNDKGEIDAVMNVDGQGILLSEMQDSGLITNAGWLSNLVKVAVAVAVVAVVVAVVAVAVVATAGAAAPAVVAVGVGVFAAGAAGAAGTAATIATVAAVTAAVAAGVAITAYLLDQMYPGIDATTTTVGGTQVVTVPWDNVKTKEAIEDITISERKSQNPRLYFEVTSYNGNGPVTINMNPMICSEMALGMRTLGWSSITGSYFDAGAVLLEAFPGFPIVLDVKGTPHWHSQLPNLNRMAVAGLTIHSYFMSI